jgi:hypothetical protein
MLPYRVSMRFLPPFESVCPTLGGQAEEALKNAVDSLTRSRQGELPPAEDGVDTSVMWGGSL